VLGGSADDKARGIALGSTDSTGFPTVYVAGRTDSPNFPTVPACPAPGALQCDQAGGDAFVTRLRGDGASPLYSTYLGGAVTDEAAAIAVSPEGNAYVAGFTTSPDFPLTKPLQSALAGQNDGFVTALNAAGTARIYSTYLAGNEFDPADSVAVDSFGNAYVS